MRYLASFLLLAVCFTVMPAHAQKAEGPWRLTKSVGAVRIMAPGEAVRDAQAGSVVATGASITTGADGSAVLDNGAQRISITPNSRMTIAPPVGGLTRILQDVGSLLFEVDHQTKPHFKVEAPMLAAVVKGTTFTVSASPDENQVHVARGLVEVRANVGASFRDVATGETVRIVSAAPTELGLTVPAKGAIQLTTPPPALDYQNASGGVIDSATPQTQGARSATASVGATRDSPIAVGAQQTGTAAAGAALTAVTGATDVQAAIAASVGGDGNRGGTGATNIADGNGGNGNGNNGNGNNGNGNGNGNSGNGNGNSGNGNSGNGNSGNGNGNSGNGNSGNGNNGNGNGNSGNGNSGNGNNGNGNGNSGNGNSGNGNNGNGNGNNGNGNSGNGNNGNGSKGRPGFTK